LVPLVMGEMKLDHIRVLILQSIMALLLSNSMLAIETRLDREKVVAEESWRGRKGELTVYLVITADPKGFLQQWKSPPRPGYVPEVTSSPLVSRGTEVGGFVLFSGCKVNDDGTCDATVDWLLLKPDGTGYADRKRGVLWKEKPIINTLMLSATNLGLRIELEDPLGQYIMKATVNDHVQNVSLEVEAKLMVVPKE